MIGAVRIEQLAPNVILYLGDCSEVLSGIDPTASVISDPPYGIAYKHSGAGRRGLWNAKNPRRNTNAVVGDDKPFDPEPLLRFENVLLWGADHFYPRLPDRGRLLAWNKLGDLEPWDSFSDVEFAWHSHEGAARLFNWKWKGIVGDKRGENNSRRDHPTQKPISLMRWSIQQAGYPGKIVDPYMGSGTTGVAAAQLGLGFVGIEIVASYFEIACSRIAEVLKQPNMFAEALD